MRALLILAAALVITSPAQARDDKEAATRCAAGVARLDKPLNDPSARMAVYFWSVFIDHYRPIPYEAAAMSQKVIAQCGDDGRRDNAWSFTVHLLAASGDLDGAQAVAEERLRLSPSNTALEELAEVRLRKGDETGALDIVRGKALPGRSDEEMLARMYRSLTVERDADQSAALALLRRGEQHWRALAEVQRDPDTTIRLAGMIARQGSPQERMNDNKAAAVTYARVEATLAPLRTRPLDGFDENGVEAVLMDAYVSGARVSAAAGDRAGVLDSASKAVSLAQDEPFTVADGTFRGEISINRWMDGYPARFSVDYFRQIADDLMRVDAPREALPLLKAVAEFRAEVAKIRARPDDGVNLIKVARAQRLAGEPEVSLKTIDASLVLMRAEAKRPTPVGPIEGYMMSTIAEGVLERGLALDALGRGADACAAFRDARTTYSPNPTVYPVTDPLLTRLDEAVARPACAA
jgi:tetratricopeptide (TPR) repeat protein